MNNVIPFNYNGQSVRFSTEGWINATDVAKRYGKRLDHWLKNAETLEYIQALDEIMGGQESNVLDTRNSGYVKTSRARSDRGGGTWLHPKLAVVFARWCNVRFAVWCDLHIDALMRGELTEHQQFNKACKALDNGQRNASTNGRELAQWKYKKPDLVQRVAYWRDQLQMTLGLEVA